MTDLLNLLATGELTLKWAWALALLPLPLLLYLFDKINNRQKPSNPKDSSENVQGALQVPFFQQLSAQVGTVNEPEKPKKRPAHWWKWLLLSLSWALLVLAVSRPTLVGEKVPLPVAGRDIMMAVDLSGSMAEMDLKVNGNRLDVVKATADEFIKRRAGDRVGLIFFSERAYLQAPLTFDRTVVRQLLTEANVGLTGQKTAIGDAIAIGLKRLRETEKVHTDDGNANSHFNANSNTSSNTKKESQVLILLTDGANNAGVTEPEKATEIAKKLGIKIYTIGVGGKGQVVNTPFGKRMMATSDLDEPALQRIAKQTGGRYFRATDMAELEQIYQAIDQLEPIDRDPQFLRPETEIYYYPALWSLVVLILLGVVLGLGKLGNGKVN